MSGIRLGKLTKPNCDILAASFADDLAHEFSTFDIVVLDINIFHKQENTNFLTATCTYDASKGGRCFKGHGSVTVIQ